MEELKWILHFLETQSKDAAIGYSLLLLAVFGTLAGSLTQITLKGIDMFIRLYELTIKAVRDMIIALAKIKNPIKIQK